MPLEAEQKARVRDPEGLHHALGARGDARRSVYSDTYFDSSDGSFVAEGRELRVRVVESETDVRNVLTLKGTVVDEGSGSKSETETTVGDPAATRVMLEEMGYRQYVALTKECTNVELTAHGYDMLATVVHVPELDGTFLELETVIADDADLTAAIEAVHGVLGELGIDAADYTTETYTDAVLAARRL